MRRSCPTCESRAAKAAAESAAAASGGEAGGDRRCPTSSRCSSEPDPRDDDVARGAHRRGGRGARRAVRLHPRLPARRRPAAAPGRRGARAAQVWLVDGRPVAPSRQVQQEIRDNLYTPGSGPRRAASCSKTTARLSTSPTPSGPAGPASCSHNTLRMHVVACRKAGAGGARQCPGSGHRLSTRHSMEQWHGWDDAAGCAVRWERVDGSLELVNTVWREIGMNY